MTTIIYGCPSDDAFTPQQATLLANICHEPEWIIDDGLEMEKWDDKLIITTAREIEIHGSEEGDFFSYDEAMALIQNDLKNKPEQQTRINKFDPGMTVTDGIDLVALLIENDLCSDETPEHIKADLRVLAQIIKMIQMIYPFTASDDVADIEHRKYIACEELRLMSQRMREIFTETNNGKYHKSRIKQAEAQS